MSRTMLVTGASRGIGRRLVGELARRGHRVIATCRDPESIGGDRPGALARVLPLDTTDPASCASAAAHVRTTIGQLDVLVNNAGIKRAPGWAWAASAGPIDALEPDAVAAVLGTNVVGTLNVTRAFAPLLGRGSVVANISSQLGSLADGVGVDYGYNASKAALNMVTVTMQRDLGPRGVTAVAINPGWMRTEMGGDDAPLAVADAVADIAALLGRLDGAFGGRFVDRHGEQMRW